jgi:MFS family permease
VNQSRTDKFPVFRLNAGFKRILRRLLQADRPVPPRNAEEIAAEQARNYRWNFTTSTLDAAFFWFGISFISAGTILPLFISKLTDSTLPLGIVAIIAQGSWLLPQLFTANAVERLARKKPVVVNLGFFAERLPMWGMLLAPLVAKRSPQLTLVLFLLAYAWFGLGGGVVATAWQDLVARCFPVNRRGRFWGFSSFVGIGIGAAGSGFSAWVLKTFSFPTSFIYLFAIAAVSINLSWLFLALVREPVEPARTERQSNRQFWAGLLPLLRRDHNFRRFMVSRMLLALGNMGSGFITVAAVSRWDVSDATVGVYTAASLLGQMFGNLLFGLLSDRFGHKLSLELGACTSFLGFALAWLAPAAHWYYAVFLLLGFGASASIVSGVLVVMEFCEPSRRPTYLGLANTLTGLVSVAGPLLGAGLATWSYGYLFALSAVVKLASLGTMRWWVRDPRWENGALVSAD